jgi:DNA-binding PadR family transcriptional regulator
LVRGGKVAKETQTKNPEGKVQMRTVYSLTPLGDKFIEELRESLQTFLGLIIELAE